MINCGFVSFVQLIRFIKRMRDGAVGEMKRSALSGNGTVAEIRARRFRSARGGHVLCLWLVGVFRCCMLVGFLKGAFATRHIS